MAVTSNTMIEGKRLKTVNDGSVVTKSKEGAISEVGGHTEQANDAGLGTTLGQLHPLRNPVILTHLFERCPPKLLAQLRLVCKQWFDLSLTSWRATAQLTLYDRRHKVIPKYPTFEKYLKFVDDPQNKCDIKPHRRMRLVRWENDMRKPALHIFWHSIGRNLTSLEFQACEFDRVETFRWIIFRSCPNLQRLYLHSCRCFRSALVKAARELQYSEPTFGEQPKLRLLSFQVFKEEEVYCFDPRSYRLPVPWLELLSHFPFMTSLSLKLSIRPLERCDKANKEIVQAIELIRRQDQRKLRLRNLDLAPPFKISTDEDPHSDIISRLQELKFPLQSLKIKVNLTHQLNHDVVESILERLPQTLTRLSIAPKTIRSLNPISWRFPCNVMLGKLEELRIQMLPESLSFLKNIPNLRKLEIAQAPGYTHYKETETRIIPEGIPIPVKLPKLAEFRLEYRVTKEDITKLAMLMPNVTKLAMSLNDKLFATVCQVWVNLKELEVLGDFDLTDLGVTGIKAKGRPSEDGVGKWNENVSANITNLQDLHSFRFWSNQLTKRSVYDGFLKLPNLTELEVCAEGRTPFGPDELLLLRGKGIEYLGGLMV